MQSTHYYPNLQPRYGQNGIGNIEHDLIIPYISQNKRLNGKANSRSKKNKKKAKPKIRMIANVYNTKFELVKNTLERIGFDLSDEESTKNCFLIWTDAFVSQEKMAELKSFQKLNHFLGMGEISRKDFCAKKIAKMQKIRPDDYQFFPKTWLFPQERNLFQKYLKETKDNRKKKYFILKPANGAMGAGIKLYSEDDNIKATESSIVQEYISRPFLLDGYKNDLRIYVLVTCCDPLRAYIYKEGLVRLGTEKYVLPNDLKTESHFIHLTNYSVNKKNSNYKKSQEDSAGSKRSLSYLLNLLQHKFQVDTDALWKEISDMVVKTLLLVQPHLIHNYRMSRPGQLTCLDNVCFEVLGFDILLDEFKKPWLLEINRSPSFGMDELLDRKVKGALLEDTLRLINIRQSDKTKYISLQKQRANKRLTLAAIKTRIDTQLSHEYFKKRKEIDRKKQDLIDQLIKVKSFSARDYYENRNIGNFKRIFPSDDTNLLEKYTEILSDSFVIFNQIHTSTQNSSSTTNISLSSSSNTTNSQVPSHHFDVSQLISQVEQSCQFKFAMEEEIVEQIKMCEIEENQILSKFNLPQNSEQTTLIPKVDFYESSSDESDSSSESSLSSSSSSSPSTSSSKHSSSMKIQQRSVTPQIKGETPKTELPKRSASVLNKNLNDYPNMKNQNSVSSSTQPSNIKRDLTSRSIDLKSKVPGSTANKDPLKTKQESGTGNSKHHPVNEKIEKFIESRNRHNVLGPEIYNELLKIILTSLNKLTIRYPGQEESATKVLLHKIQNNWELHKKSVANYWLVNLNSRKRQKIIDIVRHNVDSIMEENFQYTSNLCFTRLNRLFEKLYNRLLWNRGHGLMQCFSNVKSWKIIFTTSEDQLRPMEIDICGRVVQLCLDCVMIVYHYSLKLAETRSTANNTDVDVPSSDNRPTTPTSLFFKTNGKRPLLSEASQSSISIIPNI